MYLSSIRRIALTGTMLSVVSVAGGCSSIDRLSQIGEQPKLSSIENPTTQPGYKPVQMPMPKPEAVSYNANSLWRNGSRAFFRDQRAHQIGDLLTVTVNFTDKANFANETQRSRSNTEDSGITNFLGASLLTGQRRQGAARTHPGPPTSTASSDGKGSVQRQESLTTNIAAVVTLGCCRTATWWSRASRKSASTSKMRELIVRAGHRAPGGYPERPTPSIPASDRAGPASPMAATARSPTCNSRDTSQQVMDILLPF